MRGVDAVLSLDVHASNSAQVREKAERYTLSEHRRRLSKPSR
jgi:hypothetical protein